MANNNETLNQEETVENQQTPASINVSDIIGEYIENSLDGDLVFFAGVKNYLDHFHTYLLKNGKKQQSEQCKKQMSSNELKLELTRLIQAKTLPIYDTLRKLEHHYFSNLSLDAKQNKKLTSALHTLSVSELYHLVQSEKQRNKFILKQSILSRDELDKKLQGINKSEQKILEKIFGANSTILSVLPSNPDLLESIFSIANASLSVDESDIQKVLESSLFDNDQRNKLVQYFFPVVSLDFAQRNNLLHKDAIENYLGQIAQSYHLTPEETTAFIKKVDLGEVFVDTKTLHISTFGSGVYQAIAQEINDSKIETVDIFGKDAFLLECRKNKLSLNFDKFKEGNYFTIEYPKNQAGEKEKQYFYIKNIGAMSVEFVNVTKKNGISASVEHPQNLKGKTEVKTYQEFFHDLSALSEKSQLTAAFEEKDDLKNQQGEEIDLIAEKDEVQNIADVAQALDELDPKGKGISIAKMGISFKKQASGSSLYDEEFFYVTEARDDFIQLDNGQTFQGPEQLKLFVEIFEDLSCARFEKIDSADDFLTKMESESSLFNGIVYDHGRLVAKEHKADHHAPGINLFVGDNQETDGSIVINEIHDGKISFSFGEFKESTKKGEPGNFDTKVTAEDLSFTEFYMFIKNRKLKARKEKYESHDDHHDDHHAPHLHQHGSLLTTWLSRFWSISELSAGAHQLIHAVEHSLETGNKLKSAKAALAMGRFLPTHIRVELQSQVEKSEKETMEKIKGEMLGVDWKDMWPMVEHVLENSSAPQYEVEAAMFAVMKYGSLYPKDLAPYRGQYVWFKKLGGHPSMIPILTENALANDPDLVVTEEVLINALLAMQAKGVPGYRPKRRSKIHKEFGKTIIEGVNNEMGDGEREAGVRMTVDGRIDYLMNEFKGTTLAHGVGGMEKVWDKGPDPAWKMNTLPFVIMASGISLNMHQKLINQLKSYAFTTPYGCLAFVASKSGVEFYQNYVRKVIELRYGPSSDILNAYNSIQHPSKGSSQEAAYNFWKKYGKELYPIINMNDGYVISQKDKEGNDLLNDYYGKIKGIYTGKDFSVKREHITGGHYDAANSPIVQTGALIDDYVYAKDRGYLDDTASTVISSALDYFSNIVKNNSIDETERKELFKKEYSHLERKIFSLILPYTADPDQYSKFPIYTLLKENGFDVYPQQLHDKNNSDEVKAFYKNGYDDFLEQQFYNVKNRSQVSQSDIFAQKTLVQHSIDTIMNTDYAANDNQIRKRA